MEMQKMLAVPLHQSHVATAQVPVTFTGIMLELFAAWRFSKYGICR